jgi:lipocalin-like protein
MLAEKIIGVWELQIWETVVDDKVIGYPLGEKASGFIAYHPIGFMSVNISAPNRVRLATDDPFAGDPKLLALDARAISRIAVRSRSCRRTKSSIT